VHRGKDSYMLFAYEERSPLHGGLSSFAGQEVSNRRGKERGCVVDVRERVRSVTGGKRTGPRQKGGKNPRPSQAPFLHDKQRERSLIISEDHELCRREGDEADRREALIT